jgi:hypothetical protein
MIRLALGAGVAASAMIIDIASPIRFEGRSQWKLLGNRGTSTTTLGDQSI